MRGFPIALIVLSSLWTLIKADNPINHDQQALEHDNFIADYGGIESNAQIDIYDSDFELNEIEKRSNEAIDLITNIKEDTTNDSNIGDWEPVQAQIFVNQSQTYVFPVNYSSIGFSKSSQIMIFISGSICSLPESMSVNKPDNGLNLFYTFNQNLTNLRQMDSLKFVNGYIQGIAKLDVVDANENLYITVTPDKCDECASDEYWVYEVGVSQNSLVFQYDIGQKVSVLDTDYDSVLLSASEIEFSDINSSFKIYVYDYELLHEFQGLNQSWCAIRSSQDYVKAVEIKNTTVTGNYSYFSIDNLNQSSTYAAVVVEDYTNAAFGGAVYKFFEVETAGSEACKVIYGLDFCSEVSYSVPVSEAFYEGSQSIIEMARLYDSYASEQYQNFQFALQQIPCDTELDARYSPIRTCADCDYSYRSWLCAVTIPRCSAEEQPLYKAYEAGDGRNDFIREHVIPALDYYEVLPCVNVCHAIVRDCPSEFGFMCPTEIDKVKLSYSDDNFLDAGDNYLACNLIGTDNQIISFANRITKGDHTLWTAWLLAVVLYTLI